MLKITANKPIPLDFNSFTDFEQAYLRQGISQFFKSSTHPHPRSGKLRTYPDFVAKIKDICTQFALKAQSLLANVYEQGYTPGMAGSSFWDKRLYDADDKSTAYDWITLSHEFPNPKFVLSGDIISIG